MEMELKQAEAAIEAVLFTMGESVEVSKLAAAIDHDEDTTRKIVHNMMDKYEAEDRGIKIIELENAFQLCTKQEYYENLIKVASRENMHCPMCFWKRSRLSLINSPLPKWRLKKSVV